MNNEEYRYLKWRRKKIKKRIRKLKMMRHLEALEGDGE
jgi:hypothetical protein